MEKKMKEKIGRLKEEMDSIIKDRDVPRNVKEKIKKAKKEIENDGEAEDVRIARVIYLLNDISEDINLPFHSRTDVMNLSSQFEEIKEELKED